MADRPGELNGGQPSAAQLGSPGPGQGFSLKLARQFEGRLALAAGEHEHDALAGAAAVANKRASLFGRSPVIHDIRVGLAVWGFLAEAPEELVKIRRAMFAEISHPHDYTRARAVVDAVSAEVLHQPDQAILDQAKADWRSVLAL